MKANMSVRQLITIVMYVGTVVRVDTSKYVIDDSDGLGRRFDGIGGISGGGATSKLLINYPEPYRSQILDFLFLPNFGTSLHILKVEIGGDGQSTDGTEASHMHYSWDENYERGYEWWLMVEAKKRNPDIEIYGLPWTFPGWLNDQGENTPYKYPVKTATYIIKWIQGAMTTYNITVDYVGIWNENKYDKQYIKTLRNCLDNADLSHVKIVAADDNDWKICPDIITDHELSVAVEIVGGHYPGTLTTPTAVKVGKPLWASEDYSTFNDAVGGGCWARLLNQNYVNGNITGTLGWNLIAAYYESLPHTREGLMTAESPWSGNYVVESPIWITAHTTQFTKIGWSYYKHGQGAGHLDKGGSYVALQSPDGKDLTVVIETMSHDHSKCIRPPLPAYTVQPQDIQLQLKGTFATLTTLNIWHSQLRYSGNTSSVLFQKLEPVKVVNGSVHLRLGVDEVITLTTLSSGQKGSYPTPPTATDFPLPYYEDFEGCTVHSEPYNFAQQTGSFEVLDSGDQNVGKVMRQMVIQRPIYWCSADLIGKTSTLIGSAKWKDIFVAARFRLGKVNGSDGAYIAARVDKGGCQLPTTKGIFFSVFPKTGKYIVSTDIGQSSVIKSGSVGNLTIDGWNYVALLVQGNTATGLANGEVVFNSTVPSNVSSGFVGLGTSSFGIADFDNILMNRAAEGLKIVTRIKHRVVSGVKQFQDQFSETADDTLYFKPTV